MFVTHGVLQHLLRPRFVLLLLHLLRVRFVLLLLVRHLIRVRLVFSIGQSVSPKPARK